jgi:hypothetical protein
VRQTRERLLLPQKEGPQPNASGQAETLPVVFFQDVMISRFGGVIFDNSEGM